VAEARSSRRAAVRRSGSRPDLVIRGGKVADATGERRADVAVAEGEIVAVGPELEVPGGAVVLDASGCLVTPGFVDLHTHLREPGGENAETIETGTRAAVLGGYTAVMAMPNTSPAIDCAPMVQEVLQLAKSALCEVQVAGAITKARAGEELAPMAEMKDLGVRLFTDDGAGVQDGALMRRALDYAKGLDVTLAQHCEDRALSEGGYMHEGEWSSRLGVPAQPAAAEESMVARDLSLVRLTGARLHLLHLSCAGSISMLRSARAEGVPVTAEVTPHHLSLTDACLGDYDPVFKVNPPLRPLRDVAELRQACVEGLVDAVATDHAPHPPESKDCPLDEAAPGMLGLQTSWPVTLASLRPEMDVAQIIALLSWRPARVAGIALDQGGDQGGPIAPGSPANICVVDATATWTVEPSRLASRAKNSPFVGRTLTGLVRHTVAKGEAVVIDGEAQR